MILKNSEFISVKGRDSFKFLQGQLTQDLNLVKPDNPMWSLVLTPNGTVIQLIKIYLIEDEFYLLEVPREDAGVTLNRLKRFMLRTNAQIVMFDRAVAFTSLDRSAIADECDRQLDQDAADLKNLIVEAVSESSVVDDTSNWDMSKGSVFGETFLSKGLGQDRVLIFDRQPAYDQASFDSENFKSGRGKVGASEKAAVTALEILTSTLCFNLGNESKILPAEIPKMLQESVSFAKGCYVGQELVERIDSRKATTPNLIVPVALNLKDFSDKNITSDGFKVEYVSDEKVLPVTLMENIRIQDYMLLALRVPKKILSDPNFKAKLQLSSS